jgi:hypothetical protein
MMALEKVCKKLHSRYEKLYSNYENLLKEQSDMKVAYHYLATENNNLKSQVYLLNKCPCLEDSTKSAKSEDDEKVPDKLFDSTLSLCTTQMDSEKNSPMAERVCLENEVSACDEKERKRSLILSNLTECHRGGVHERVRYDLNMVIEVLRFLNVEAFPQAVYRLGRFSTRRTRLLKIVLPASLFQKQVLERVSFLKNFRVAGSKIFIRPSLTKEERNERKHQGTHSQERKQVHRSGGNGKPQEHRQYRQYRYENHRVIVDPFMQYSNINNQSPPVSNFAVSGQGQRSFAQVVSQGHGPPTQHVHPRASPNVLHSNVRGQYGMPPQLQNHPMMNQSFGNKSNIGFIRG